MPKFAANLTMMFNEVPFLERFEAAAVAGFKYVEYLWPYDYPVQQLKAKLIENGLQQVLFNTSGGDIGGGEWGICALPGREEEARRDIDRALEYAIGLNCPRVLLMAGVVPPGEDKEEYRRTFIDNVRYASKQYRPYGIDIMLEALSPEVKPNYLYSSQYQALELAELIDCDNVYIQLDYYHAQNVDGNLSRLTNRLKQRLGHIQIASVPDRHEPDEGEINYVHLFGLLDAIGYEGFVGCEYQPRTTTQAGLGWFEQYK
ncbi:hydroxypyruvate isomerase [Mesocricetibacter intestinalis]|uniref:Hydroxypyruvate isomerase n=1 Tax=Mesocricetibacter intestinalis TaxID=1521930 RepID=A0A4V3D9Y2_9PAST|nr:2-oxo-tetronate isomerase [Mesocricetibacter intestinalis]TDQ59383.1 hydroxypyruvate isomerase [Mesocricetibacter intestinalis]